jgi:hypothetical protein
MQLILNIEKKINKFGNKLEIFGVFHMSTKIN